MSLSPADANHLSSLNKQRTELKGKQDDLRSRWQNCNGSEVARLKAQYRDIQVEIEDNFQRMQNLAPSFWPKQATVSLSC
jgi:Tfp pilus assembly protein PilO